jgi:putative PIN family toxin of toxin-antitoxin system
VRVFLDTNVLVAAFATRGLCADVLRMVLAEHELLLSGTVLDELTRTLVDKIRVPEPTVREINVFLRASASLADPPSIPPPVAIRDPDDAVILAEALGIGAEVLVTGDKDLLEAGEVPGIKIVDPRGFWQLVRGQRRPSSRKPKG